MAEAPPKMTEEYRVDELLDEVLSIEGYSEEELKGLVVDMASWVRFLRIKADLYKQGFETVMAQVKATMEELAKRCEASAAKSKESMQNGNG